MSVRLQRSHAEHLIEERGSDMSSAKNMLIFISVLLLALAHPAIAEQTVPMCQADQLTLSVHNAQVDSGGKSPPDMVLSVLNHGNASCTLPARPEVGFEDGRHQVVPAAMRRFPGMHPGPVLVPIVLPAHASAASEVRWVSGCATPAFVSLQIAGQVIRTPFQGGLCASHEAGPYYRATLFALVR
jgi:hypothetical protein